MTYESAALSVFVVLPLLVVVTVLLSWIGGRR